MTTDTEEGLCLDDFHWDEELDFYRFECTKGTAYKFYEVELLEDAPLGTGEICDYVVVTRYGSMKPGAAVRENRAGFSNKYRAIASVEDTIQKRMNHGYERVSERHV